MERTFRILLWTAAVLLVACIAILAYGLAFEKPFLRYENLPFPAKLQQVKRGEVIPILVRRCSTASEDRFYDVTHELRSQSDPGAPTYLMKTERVLIRPGCHESTSMVNRVPPDTPPGTYVATGLGVVDGMLRQLTVPWHSQPFEVLP
jgi:hypothetical protein